MGHTHANENVKMPRSNRRHRTDRRRANRVLVRRRTAQARKGARTSRSRFASMRRSIPRKFASNAWRRSRPQPRRRPNVRVGDELEVDLVHARMPIPTSALAIVGDRLVEVEHAANAAGETIKIKIIDIDDDGNDPRRAPRADFGCERRQGRIRLPRRERNGRRQEASPSRRSRSQERTHGRGARRTAARACRGSGEGPRRSSGARHLDDGRSRSRRHRNA